jgi:hypothetical protein
MDRGDTDSDLERVAIDFHDLLGTATVVELRAPTSGTKWTNEQLLFHMLFGYLLARTLLVLVRAFARLPDAVSRAFATALNAATRPFHVVNYLAALPGPRVLSDSRRADAWLRLLPPGIRTSMRPRPGGRSDAKRQSGGCEPIRHAGLVALTIHAAPASTTP